MISNRPRRVRCLIERSTIELVRRTRSVFRVSFAISFRRRVFVSVSELVVREESLLSAEGSARVFAVVTDKHGQTPVRRLEQAFESLHSFRVGSGYIPVKGQRSDVQTTGRALVDGRVTRRCINVFQRIQLLLVHVMHNARPGTFAAGTRVCVSLGQTPNFAGLFLNHLSEWLAVHQKTVKDSTLLPSAAAPTFFVSAKAAMVSAVVCEDPV